MLVDAEMKKHDDDPFEGMERLAPDIEMLSEPLMTEEGFINPAAMAQIEAAIASIPPDNVRLAGDPEWSTARWTTECGVLAAFAGAVVRGFTGAPPNLEKVTGFVKAALRLSTFDGNSDLGGIRIVEISLCDISRNLHEVLDGLQMWRDWNDVEKVGPNWIDLDATIRNVCLLIRQERRAFDAFNERFDRENGGNFDELRANKEAP